MLTIVTGAPGAGKTALLVELMAAVAKGRIIYAAGIPDLKIPHTVLDDVSKWPDLVPDGAAVFISEAQTQWRPRGPGQKVPSDIQALETHRHRGLDFFVDTQNPALIDKNVRALCGRHIHLRDVGVLGRRWYEWPEISENLSWRTAPIRKKYRLPAKVFDQYKSASLHVKPIRSFPMAVAFGGLALVGLAYYAWQAYGLYQRKIVGPTPSIAAVPANGSGSLSVGAKPVGATRPRTAADFRRVALPAVPSRPETAPMYDELRKVVRMPRIMGGYCQEQRCYCYIQNAMKAPITEAACAEWIANPPFDPYYTTAPQQAGAAPTPSYAASGAPA